jgi:hypothetical protein
MRAFVTNEERRDAALDVANFLCEDGLDLTQKYPDGSTFTAVGQSDDGDLVLQVQLPGRTEAAIESIPASSLRYLRPRGVNSGPINSRALNS